MVALLCCFLLFGLFSGFFCLFARLFLGFFGGVGEGGVLWCGLPSAKNDAQESN